VALGLAAVGEANAQPPSVSVDLAQRDRHIDLPAEPYHYAGVMLPDYVASVADRFDNTPMDNPITDHGATLGRVLFYDTTLSKNQSTSCASCHLQKLAFTDGKPQSVGFDGRQVRRNSMSLINLRYYSPGKFFWDERADSLESQVLMPIEDPVEMGHRLDDLVPQLQSDPIYPPLFHAAFGDGQVSRDRIAKALAQFVRSIVSFGSPFDIGRAQVESVLDPFPNFTEQENYGKEQFFGRAKCADCHLPSQQTELSRHRQSAFFQLAKPTVNGVDNNSPEVDRGVGEHTGRSDDAGRFKASSLRNIELTAPYMHDGRFITLDQVVEHYNWSVRPHDNLDPLLQDFAANGLALPEVEKVALTQFLLTLTDHELTNDSKFSDPFQ
jgi:cytochrome c peroxidase